MEAGQSVESFGRSTPYAIQVAIYGYLDRQDRFHNELAWTAWHIAAMQRAEKMPTFDEMMGVPPRVMDDEELEAELERWMASQNARLSPEDRHYIVAELVED